MWSEGVRLADRTVETLVAAALRVVPAPRVREWSPCGGRVVAVAPHPDDETACGGALARHAIAGDAVTILFVTDGRRSRAFGLAPEEMARRRRREALASAEALGARAVWIGLPEGETTLLELTTALAGHLAALAPDLVYAPSRVDFHPVHVAVAHALAGALEPFPAIGVRIYGAQVPLTRVLVNMVCDVAPARERLARALAAHATQAGTLRAAWRPRRYAASTHRRAGPAEELRETTAARYAAAHAGPPDAAPHRTFRGMHPHPFLDPFAFAAGRGPRKKLAEIL